MSAQLLTELPFEDPALQQAEQARIARAPLAELDPANWNLFRTNAVLALLERLRREDPVHYHETSFGGPYWSLTGFDAIKAVDTDHERFSSQDNISIADQVPERLYPSFIAMDPPLHDAHRKSVAPVAGPRNLAAMEPLIRGRVATVLDSLPRGEPFNWVDRVSIELTTQMLATLFDFPFEERARLTRWSDVATGGVETGVVASLAQRDEELMECLACFTELFEARKQGPAGHDLISMLAQNPATAAMSSRELLGNVLLLIVGGNDTTRNSMTGGVLALNQFPEQYRRLHEAPELIPNMVAEIIRWQTPLAHMRRTALTDVEIGGKTIRQGDKVVMWYLSGNRDETVFPRGEQLDIERANARSHLSFGYGLHRCMGNRLAELQLRILWEEIQQRFAQVRVLGRPERITSNFVRGYATLPVEVVPR